jgi:hypothetical protein
VPVGGECQTLPQLTAPIVFSYFLKRQGLFSRKSEYNIKVHMVRLRCTFRRKKGISASQGKARTFKRFLSGAAFGLREMDSSRKQIMYDLALPPNRLTDRTECRWVDDLAMLRWMIPGLLMGQTIVSVVLLQVV